jgi:hypothetical protein
VAQPCAVVRPARSAGLGSMHSADSGLPLPLHRLHRQSPLPAVRRWRRRHRRVLLLCACMGVWNLCACVYVRAHLIVRTIVFARVFKSRTPNSEMYEFKRNRCTYEDHNCTHFEPYHELRKRVRECVCTHINKFTHEHTHMQSHTHRHTHTKKQTQTQEILSLICLNTRKHAHIYTNSSTQTCVPIHMHTHTHTCYRPETQVHRSKSPRQFVMIRTKPHHPLAVTLSI